MTRRIVRKRDFEASLQIKNDAFIRPPRDAQRNWLLNKALQEMAENLSVLDQLAKRFVPGTSEIITQDRKQAALEDQDIMEDWQLPLMKAMADDVTASHGSVLEIGFGRGVASSYIQEGGVSEHTIIECNASIVDRFEAWKARYGDSDISMVVGMWQDVLDDLGHFDGIFFHTYPLNEEEFVEQIGNSATFAEHFFPHAAQHLVDGGVFTYLSNEIDSLSRTHQRSLFKYFTSIEMRVVDNLDIPEDVKDAWWSDSMVVVKAIK